MRCGYSRNPRVCNKAGEAEKVGMAVRVFLILCIAGVGFLLYVYACLMREGKQGQMPGQAHRRRITQQIHPKETDSNEPKS
jgi:hypothetical protein